MDKKELPVLGNTNLVMLERKQSWSSIWIWKFIRKIGQKVERIRLNKEGK